MKRALMLAAPSLSGKLPITGSFMMTPMVEEPGQTLSHAAPGRRDHRYVSPQDHCQTIAR